MLQQTALCDNGDIDTVKKSLAEKKLYLESQRADLQESLSNFGEGPATVPATQS